MAFGGYISPPPIFIGCVSRSGSKNIVYISLLPVFGVLQPENNSRMEEPGMVAHPVILATWEAEIGRKVTQDQPRQKVQEIHLNY
jgi:hypothetical protein